MHSNILIYSSIVPALIKLNIWIFSIKIQIQINKSNHPKRIFRRNKVEKIFNNTWSRILKWIKLDGTCSYLLQLTRLGSKQKRLEKVRFHSITKNKNKKINKKNRIFPNPKSEQTIFCNSNNMWIKSKKKRTLSN